MPAERTARVYYLEGFVQIEASSDEEANALFEEAGLGIDHEVIPGVVLNFEGPWDEIDEVERSECICPPDLIARGGFRGGCPVHG